MSFICYVVFSKCQWGREADLFPSMFILVSFQQPSWGRDTSFA